MRPLPRVPGPLATVQRYFGSAYILFSAQTKILIIINMKESTLLGPLLSYNDSHD